MTDVWCDKLNCIHNERALNKSYFWGTCTRKEITIEEDKCANYEEAESVSV